MYIHGNHIHDVAVNTASSVTKLHHAVYIGDGSHGIDFGWNRISNNKANRGVQIYTSTTGSGDIYDVHVHDNLIHDNRGVAILFSSVNTSRGPAEAFNNVMYNAGTGPDFRDGVSVWACMQLAPSGGVAVEVYNNTAYKCGSSSSSSCFTGGPANLRNNICNQPSPLQYGSSSNQSCSNNLFYGNGSAPSGCSTGVLNVNPQFVNLGGFDFHLSGTSPAKDAGTAIGGLAADRDGVPRPQGTRYDIGAYEVPGGGSILPSTPDLTISKTHSGSFTQGQSGATYTITVGNSGSAATVGVVTVIDALPSGLTATALSGSGWTCAVATITCTRSTSVAAGSSYPAITLTVNVSSTAPSSVVNSVQVAGGGETNTSNNVANDPTTISTAGDSAAPSVPTGVTATPLSSSRIDLSWNPSTDNPGGSGVAGYHVFRNGVQVGTPSGTTFSDTGLNASTTYNYRVSAFDAAAPPNESAQSSQVSATTKAGTSFVSSYSFEEGAGTTTADASGNNPGTLVNGPTWTTAGRIGKALSFDGSNDYVDIGNGAQLQITGSMSISAWIFPTAHPNDDATIVSRRDSKRIGFQLDTSVDTGARTVSLKLSNGARYGATTLQTNRWYHVAGVYDAAARTVHVYLNGVLDDSTNRAVTPSGSQANSVVNVYIGRRPSGNGYEFQGTIDEVTIYDRALSQSEITALFNAGALDTEAPTAPTSLTASPAGASQINLSWGAATDNVGVTGYALERCEGATCTSFAQIATPSGTSHSDTGLTAGTAYRYRVRARDAAGNLSGYSNIASAQTQTPTLLIPDLTITKAHSGSFTRGQTGATYSITVSNVGNAATSGTVTVTDTLPSGLTATAISGSGWSCTLATAACTRSTALAAGSSYPVITVTVNVASTAASSVTNTARVSGGGESNTGNDAASDPTTIVSPVTFVSSYSFEEGSGTITEDEAGNNPGLLGTGLSWTTAGKTGSALSFSSDSDYVDIGNGSTLQMTGSMSISAWIFPTANPAGNDDAAIVSKRDRQRIGFQLDTSVDTGPRRVSLKLSSGYRYGQTELQLNQWYHVVGVYDAAARAIHIYVNGALDDSADGFAAPPSSQTTSSLNTYIGRRASGGYGFIGTIDEVQIYDRALTQAEATALFNAGSTP
jgi:uncharacterized repeat protein (TIGR01451 family)